MEKLVRTHVLLPAELVAELDRVAGKRGRSRFLAEAAVERLKRIRRVEAAKAVAGSLATVNIPGWETPASTSEWVRGLRREADERLDEQERAWPATSSTPRR
jgi:hypothetical protein